MELPARRNRRKRPARFCEIRKWSSWSARRARSGRIGFIARRPADGSRRGSEQRRECFNGIVAYISVTRRPGSRRGNGPFAKSARRCSIAPRAPQTGVRLREGDAIRNLFPSVITRRRAMGGCPSCLARETCIRRLRERDRAALRCKIIRRKKFRSPLAERPRATDARLRCTPFAFEC